MKRIDPPPSDHDRSSITAKPSGVLFVIFFSFGILYEPRGNIPAVYRSLQSVSESKTPLATGELHTFIRRSIQLSQNASIPNQSFTFQRPGINAKPNRGIHIAGLNGPSSVIAERSILIARWYSRFSIIPKSSLKAKSPIKSKENHRMMSFKRIGSGALCAMRSCRPETFLNTRGS